MTTLDAGKAALLRKPFADTAIGKLPRSTCQMCTRSDRKRCEQHQWVSNCGECHGSHSSATIHLDYVGHAATTDRLLEVDPLWSWEPMALDQTGLPLRDREGNLWIRLTICGATRLGVGDGKSLKECIGDAIRNAAMRFGVALDLWSKDELEQVTIGAERLRTAVAAELASRAGGAPEGQPTHEGREADGDPDSLPPAPPAERPRDPGDSGVQHAQRVAGDKLEAERQARIAARDSAQTDTGDPQPEAPAPESPLLNTGSRLAKRMFALFGEIKLTEKSDRLAYVSSVIGREIASSTEMTDADAERVIRAIEIDLSDPAAGGDQ